MARRSTSSTLQEMRFVEIIEVTDAISKEQIQLSDDLALELDLDYEEAKEIVMRACDEVLPGYRGVERLNEWRRIEQTFRSTTTEASNG